MFTDKNNNLLYVNKAFSEMTGYLPEEVIGKITKEKLQPKYGHARVYVKNRRDFAGIKKTFKAHYGNLPVVYIIADICRDDLLVEIEGKVILD